jgi:hypothetical protein
MDLLYHCAILYSVKAEVGSIALPYHFAFLYFVRAGVGSITLLTTVLACTLCAEGGQHSID